ncbi:hypothetical protein BKA70DRAFT_1232398 [Coprinopsis sp. MPI-PUGE-AT-0042]|nr:hypothetical protein BKA70DRAFT_1232398 [Coprinopsis sp. MPI-PUGE-AT-0042]
MASRTERKRASQQVMRAISGCGSKYNPLPNTTNTCWVPPACQDQDGRMDVDSEGGVDIISSARGYSGAAAALRTAPCIRSEKERWMIPHGEIVRSWNREEWRAKEEIIKEKAMIIRCQQRRINRLRRRLQEANDRSFLMNEMWALVKDVGNMSLDSDNLY